MAYFESILRVLLVGLVLGAGLPALFAIGLTAFSRGAGDMNADGTSQAANPALKFLGLLLFGFVSFIILIAILWITRSTIMHHFHIDPFFGFGLKK
ncbi:hypothetical protein MINS_11610 [Mycolicibacterium insubricum]|jgi:uncharacterized BrkB/YihY/UPF0761 family membrane protein|uniref:Uncharacterized protein n=1 Tax=Mycolicibacterium insubricum TaxID=444597 RepID=A0A1X0CP09_9MYCO|nr:hypothetical protein [Mycolicibacterium insubricum]MCB9440786.1 hypothetical protein [Mycolicibacterium sp.]MCV7082181.1 hypothetical protein [Mycolicibacterium insubricum]ORA61823.1 hypothetical protein BST26_21155 [Mycolicibacterium insubricum]BBZ65732.1 hypothetical protein MINS_11610 [Mycolicibacterium insubricum]